MQYHTITDIVKIPSSMLTKDLYSNILLILREKIGSCSSKYGCITNIASLDDIVDAKVCVADCTNHFKLTYTFGTFKPEIGVKYFATVYKSYPEGVLVFVENFASIRALIESFKCKEGDKVKIILTDLRLINGTYIGTGTVNTQK